MRDVQDSVTRPQKGFIQLNPYLGSVVFVALLLSVAFALMALWS